jgi:hypothetical protein
VKRSMATSTPRELPEGRDRDVGPRMGCWQGQEGVLRSGIDGSREVGFVL